MLIGRLGFVVLSFIVLLPQTPAATDLSEEIDQIMQAAYPAREPGAAVIVVKNGEVIYRGGYGMANLELGVKVEPDMVFRLGSWKRCARWEKLNSSSARRPNRSRILEALPVSLASSDSPI